MECGYNLRNMNLTFNKEISRKIKKGEDWYKVDKNGEITKIETE